MRRRWLKWSLIVLAVLLVVLVLLVVWLGTTGSGLRFALNRAVIVLDDKLEFRRAEGSLFGGMRLDDVRYSDPALGDFQVATLEIAPRSRRLLGGELHLTGLTLTDVRVVLPAPDPDPDPADDEAPFQLPEVVAPISVRIDRLRIDGVEIRQAVVGCPESPVVVAADEPALEDGCTPVPVVALDQVDGAVAWRGSTITIDALDVQAPEGELQLQAEVDTGADWEGQAQVDLRWQLPEQAQPLAGRLLLRGPQSRPSLALDLTEPSPATVALDWQGGGTGARWQLRAHSDDFDLAGLLSEPPVSRLAFDLDGNGDRNSGEVSGRVRLDDYPVDIEQLRLRWQDPVLVIEALALAEVDGSGRVDASGELDLAGEQPTGRIDARWQELSPPLAAPFNALAASGRIQASGNAEQLQAQVEAQATVDQRPLTLALRAEGDPQGIVVLQPLTLTTGDGSLDVEGRLNLAEGLAWDVTLRGRGFDPGLLVPDWPGAVELDAGSQGRLVDGSPVGRLDIGRLGGSLRQRPLGGSGWVEWAPGDRVDADLDLRLGDNAVALAGRLQPDIDAQLRFQLPEPGLLLDGASGRASGDLRASGRWPTLAIAGSVEGSGLRWNDYSAAALDARIDARTDLAGDGRVVIEATGLELAGQAVQQLSLNVDGDADASRLRLDAVAERGTVAVELAGRYDANAAAWRGRLVSLELSAPELPSELSLTEPADLELSAERIVLARACLRGADSGLCLDGDWRQQAGGDFGFELTRLPLAWLVVLVNPKLEASGELGGRGRIAIAADGSLSGQAQIQGPPGRIGLAGYERDLVAWSGLATTLELDGDRTVVEADLDLAPAGHLRARLVTGPGDGGAAPLSGYLDVDVPDLDFIGLLTPEVINPVGRLSGRLELAGTVSAPAITGGIELAGFRAELPALGLRLRDSTVALRAGSGNRIDVDGRFATAEDSTLLLTGWFGLPANGRVPMDLRISGDRVLVADLPAARVLVTPDLTVRAGEERLVVRGTVAVPQARLAPEDFEGGGASPSPDVVVIDPEALPGAEEEDVGVELPVYADITVTLGDRVTIDGYGLVGRLRGELAVRERPNRPTSARGEIIVDGDFQAYGQDLNIERGRLLFTGGPIDNPNLDIRATRRVQSVTAGLMVTGTALRPVLEVYSVPAMDQAEALSYLVLGRPLRQATSASDQDLLGTAATAVTTAGGDLLAKSLGARLGLDDVGVGSSRELGAGALTVGKYLSPRLYLGYGRSLFDGGQLVSLRYRISERLELEVQSGTRDNKAGLNYSYER